MAKNPKKSQTLSEAKDLQLFVGIESTQTAEILRSAQDDSRENDAEGPRKRA
jgi:hypothetical protein